MSSERFPPIPANASSITVVTTTPIARLLWDLEDLSRRYPSRVLRLRGQRRPDPVEPRVPEAGPEMEPFELVIFRGFSSSTTHPTAADPDQAALPEGSCITEVDLLEAPLHPGREILLQRCGDPCRFLKAEAWG